MSSYTFSDKPGVRFKLREEDLKVLLSGNVVSIKTIDGILVEFFMDDIGLDRIESVMDEEHAKLRASWQK